ncbi:cytochrome oxidase c assembly-domain-containing protein [Aspergillus coremiiformis]|uniref:Cytochrome oxidase c assembly-domain-containing protein n=1 Tax=Aspergillus coremiiformis TaxID=138285 RepID=A0A5N6YXV1_9EURO|nr:cytochrome oxidase c assembly-domain-containing protein [Aspergillus coremiiformis]
MSRSAADATRFTATGPYAHSKDGSAPYKLPGFMQTPKPKPGGRQETPKQKVERLRAQVKATRKAQSFSRIDAIIDMGRRVADKAHRITVYTLITASGIGGVLTVYSLISMTLYNRRQRALWIEKELQRLQDAKTAFAGGRATEEQLELLRNERIGEIYQQKKEEERAQRPWNKFKRYLLEGLGSEEAGAKSGTVKNQPGVLEALNAKALEEANARAAQAAVPRPGQLDSLAENAESAVKQTMRSWMSWLTGR